MRWGVSDSHVELTQWIAGRWANEAFTSDRPRRGHIYHALRDGVQIPKAAGGLWGRGSQGRYIGGIRAFTSG